MACPICDKPGQKPYAPFCSRRCADVDLYRWLKGGYAIPGDGAGEGEDPPSHGAESAENGDFPPRGKGMDRD